MRFFGSALLALGLMCMLIGTLGLLRAKGFYRRLLLSALVDTIGLALLLVGVALRQGEVAFLLKTLLLVLALMLTAPLATHKLGRSAWLSGHREEDALDE